MVTSYPAGDGRQPTLDEIAKRVEAVRNDVSHGATSIAREAVSLLADAALAYRSPAGLLGHLGFIASALAEARPPMAAVRNAAEAFIHSFRAGGADPRDGTRVRDAVLSAMQVASTQAASVAADRIPDGATVVTCSASSAVVATARAMREAGKQVRFLVLASMVGGVCQGAEVRARLLGVGVPAEVRRDAEALIAVGDADLALVGADGVLPLGGMVNGTPSLALAEACDGRIPFHAVCETFKLDPSFYPWSGPGSIASPGAAVVGSEHRNRLPQGFDRLPATLVTSYFTDKGVFRPVQVAAGEIPLFAVA